jgi:hypothetical protein
VASLQLLAPLPFLTLDAGCTVTVEAIDPFTGAAVTGVTVSLVAIYAANATGQAIADNSQVLYAYGSAE